MPESDPFLAHTNALGSFGLTPDSLLTNKNSPITINIDSYEIPTSISTNGPRPSAEMLNQMLEIFRLSGPKTVDLFARLYIGCFGKEDIKSCHELSTMIKGSPSLGLFSKETCGPKLTIDDSRLQALEVANAATNKAESLVLLCK